MFKSKILLLISILFIVDGCSLFSGKKKKQKEEEAKAATEEYLYADALLVDTDEAGADKPDADLEVNDIIATDAEEFVDHESQSLELDKYIDPSSSMIVHTNNEIEDKVDTYSDVVAGFQDDITRLRAELEMVTTELYELKAKSQIWENP